MFFKRMSAKGASAAQITEAAREAQRQRGLVEKILLAEYETAQAKFDRARELGHEHEVRECGERYIEATSRLRKFLTDGVVPGDVAEKLESGGVVKDEA